jgi:hypothetical protein
MDSITERASANARRGREEEKREVDYYVRAKTGPGRKDWTTIGVAFIQLVLRDFLPSVGAADSFRDDQGLHGGPQLAELARGIVREFEQINDLSCIMHGDDRVRGQIMGGRFQVWPEEIEEFRTYLAELAKQRAEEGGNF